MPHKKTLLAPLIFLLITNLTFTAPAHPQDQARQDTVSETLNRESIISKTLNRFSGYYKMLATFSKTTATKEAYFSILKRLRLELNPKLTENLHLNIVYDHELLLNDLSGTADFNLVRQKNQRSLNFFDADQVISDTDHVYERHLLHRLSLKFETPNSRITFGKQLIDWGRMRFYSPLDLFNQPLPSDIEADERNGFDALNVELADNGFCAIDIIYGPGKNESSSSYGLRFHKTIKSYDVSLIAAKHEKERVAGFGFDGYLFDAGIRGEFTYTKDGNERYPRASLGLDYGLGDKANIILEYFFNGAANSDYAAFSGSLTESRKRLSLKKELAGLMFTYEITPLLKFRGTCLYDISSKSAFLNPEFRYNIIENLDVAGGGQLFVESKDSEFQDYNNLYYILLKYFF